MKLKNIKITILIKLGFGILLGFVIMLGVISLLHTNKIHQQTEIMYHHPLIVRRALETLTSDVLNIRMGSKDLIFAVADQERHEANQLIKLSTANVLEQFNLLRKAYLGPRTDVEEAYEAFTRWSSAREKYNEIMVSRQIPQENNNGASHDELEALRVQLTASIKNIDEFAKNKSDELYVAANKLNSSLANQLIMLVAIIFVLSAIISYILLRNILNPLAELSLAMQRFHSGDMDARSMYESKNEFGELSAYFNMLVENIQTNSERMAYQNRELEAHRTKLRILSSQLLSAEENERKRIANNIHDSIGQALSAIKFGIENSLASFKENSDLPATSPAIEALNGIIPLTQHTIEEVRRIIMDLRPSTLDDLGLLATISWFCREYESIYTNIRIDKKTHVEEADIDPSLKVVIYRILQEALNNAAKHSHAGIIHLHLFADEEELELMVEDAGVGFEMNKMQSGNNNMNGMGLTTMKERAILSGGTFLLETSPGAGTRIIVSWPRKVS